MKKATGIAICVLAWCLAACGGEPEPVADSDQKGTMPGSEEAPALESETSVDMPSVLGQSLVPWAGTFDEMVERRSIRVLVAFSDTHFFLDGLTQRGLAADALREFEKSLNTRLGLRTRPLQVFPIPVARDQMIPFLAQDLAEMAVGNLTITPERLERVNFSIPVYGGVREIIVTGSNAPPLASLDDLAGREVFVRASSSFYTSLQELNASLAARDLEPVKIVLASEHLEGEDILELVNAGVVAITVADSHMASFWAGIFENLVLHEDLALRTGGEIGWALRKSADGLKPVVDQFVKANRKGTLIGNILFTRYLQDQTYVRNARGEESRKRLLDMADLFREYSDRYRFDWLMVAAQAYQESGLDHSKRSPAGAVGVMQLMPATAADPAVGITDIDDLESNIHAGVKYLRHLADVYFNEPGLDDFNRHLFAFAGYNAGPSRIKRLRRVAAERGLDPNLWFDNVELVVAEEVGREPVQYVRNIFKYYVTYTLIREMDEQRQVVTSGAG